MEEPASGRGLGWNERELDRIGRGRQDGVGWERDETGEFAQR
eukprot:CAMPEP_0181220952 /NCGR_PEP_ID=MMETSP1096-20121128/29120_1 /TAXON_ID=156174 ORGANISM="Chrysochromulina ericina, Strain CCMP281" /NCGR_SAMPLE_ID=MMETSP1096 /ASSEMBLY_ACC=CAM_ASM_000453 /LENGTH=41 /DNA_ID= /DNA_START= /DNA_END= /DNA_ORIENTATION=